MALLNINPSAVAGTLTATAAGKAALAVSQSMSPKLVQDVQRVLKAGNMIGQGLGIKTGIGLIDNIFSLGGADGATPLLGGLTMDQAQSIHERVRSARVTLKNLFFLRITELRPPGGEYLSNAAGGGGGGGIGGLVGSVIGGAASSVAGAVGSIAGSALGKVAGGAVATAGGALAGALGLPGGGAGANSYSAIVAQSFDLLALDVSYGPSLNGDTVQIGSAFMDRPLGRNPTELNITTMDDEAGTLKRWFQGKMDQVAHPDGTFGLPAEYLVQIEIVHAVPSEQVPTANLAYTKVMRMRAHSIQVEHSRRDQAVAELPMVFSQFDNFMGDR